MTNSVVTPAHTPKWSFTHPMISFSQKLPNASADTRYAPNSALSPSELAYPGRCESKPDPIMAAMPANRNSMTNGTERSARASGTPGWPWKSRPVRSCNSAFAWSSSP